METYQSITEKGSFFDSHEIETSQDLSKLMATLNEQMESIFRGVNNAEYKMYNSAQREFLSRSNFSINQQDYEAFIDKMVQNAKISMNSLLKKHFDSHRNLITDDAVLSFLQHYKAPTPLLDWTKNPHVALFFCFYFCSSPDKDINNYVSLYCIETIEKIPKYLDFLNQNMNALAIHWDIKDLIGPWEEDPRSFKYFKNYEVFLIPEYRESGYSFTSKPSNNGKTFSYYFNQNNLNIIAQEGLFIANSRLIEPLEHFFQSRDNDKIQKFPKIKCFNIKKSLFKDAMRLLEKQKINKKTLFPTEKQIAKMAWQNIL
ncbi:FRG domain-containing protein [Cognataquiflexum aquatile]|uniref:FRG domain-containing protein n=1 Tax=Cognataquiflexum aquatile TaxID=2249427 RepID=UPI000DEB360A|nr:FRG domain-containing protein [Cognataquiflexum aquatile]